VSDLAAVPGGRRVIVTGGAGFIGSHVVDVFVALGDEVVAVDNLSTGRRENVPSGATLAELDIVEMPALGRAVADFEPHVVCHLAAQASVTASVERPAVDLDVNVRGTLNVCEAARSVGARVIFASTGGALYGNDAPLPTPETFLPAPLSPYGASKLAAEGYVLTWGRLHATPNVVLRLGNIYGPRQNPHGEAGVVAIFSDRLVRGEPLTVYGHGKPTRDYVHVSDASRAFVVAAERRKTGTYNVGTGRETSVLALFELMRAAAGADVEPELKPLRPGELDRSALDPRLIDRELGWRAETTVEAGIPETFQAYAV
jgi:UDP-glucose 4-epimerase